MAAFFDDFDLDIPCPNCQHKNTEKYSRLKSNPQIICGNCQQPIQIQADDLNNALRDVEKQIQDLQRKISRLGH